MRLAGPVDDDVCRLQVAVHHAAACAYSIASAIVSISSAARAVPAECPVATGQSLPFHIFHREVTAPLFLADFVNWDESRDAGVSLPRKLRS